MKQAANDDPHKFAAGDLERCSRCVAFAENKDRDKKNVIHILSKCPFGELETWNGNHRKLKVAPGKTLTVRIKKNKEDEEEEEDKDLDGYDSGEDYENAYRRSRGEQANSY
jgi:hypothetical protein